MALRRKLVSGPSEVLAMTSNVVVCAQPGSSPTTSLFNMLN
jgi:hypothetical protein